MNNLLSLLLGLASWALGLGAIFKSDVRRLSALSFLSCGVSLLLQLAEVRRRVGLQDWSALLDTMDAVLLAACILLTGTAVLNLAALLKAE